MAAHRLAPPAIVTVTTRRIRLREDVFRASDSDDDCDVDIGNEWKWGPVGALFAAWSAYATQANNQPGTIKGFRQADATRGSSPCGRAGGQKASAASSLPGQTSMISMTADGCDRVRPRLLIIGVTRAQVTGIYEVPGRTRSHGPAGLVHGGTPQGVSLDKAFHHHGSAAGTTGAVGGSP